MTRSKNIVAAALTGIALTATGLTATGFGGAQASAGDMVAARIDAAFAVVAVPEADPAIQAAAARTGKGDLLVAPACSGQRWPDISPRCLVAADGTAIRPARSVTIGYRTGEAASVLIRMPAPQVASR